jgi:hypothetical protein
MKTAKTVAEKALAALSEAEASEKALAVELLCVREEWITANLAKYGEPFDSPEYKQFQSCNARRDAVEKAWREVWDSLPCLRQKAEEAASALAREIAPKRFFNCGDCSSSIEVDGPEDAGVGQCRSCHTARWNGTFRRRVPLAKWSHDDANGWTDGRDDGWSRQRADDRSSGRVSTMLGGDEAIMNSWCK